MIDIPIDFSALSTISCGRRYQLHCQRGVVTPKPHTKFGSACHKILEQLALDSGQTNGVTVTDLAIKYSQEYSVPLDKLLTIALQLKPLFSFREGDILRDINGVPLVEYKFTIPYKVIAGKYNIVLCGTIDRIYLSEASNTLVFQDYKTTVATKAAADRIVQEYQTSFQIPFYLYAIHRHISQLLPEPLATLASNCNMLGYYTIIQYSQHPVTVSNMPVITISKADIYYIEELIDILLPKIISIYERTTLYPPEGSVYKLCPKCDYIDLCSITDHNQLTQAVNALPTSPYDPTRFR